MCAWAHLCPIKTARESQRLKPLLVKGPRDEGRPSQSGVVFHIDVGAVQCCKTELLSKLLTDNQKDVGE